MHGYEMIKEIEERSGGAWRPSAGSIYPTLQLLEDEGQLEAAREARGRAQQAAPRDPASNLALARSLALSGEELERALALAADALELRRSPEAFSTLALVRSARAEFALALALADEGLALSSPGPVQAELRFRRAEALAGLGRGTAAKEALDEALHLAPSGPRSQRASARVARLLEKRPG